MEVCTKNEGRLGADIAHARRLRCDRAAVAGRTFFFRLIPAKSCGLYAPQSVDAGQRRTSVKYPSGSFVAYAIAVRCEIDRAALSELDRDDPPRKLHAIIKHLDGSGVAIRQ